MPVQAYQDDQFTFVAGLNTEAGFFGFPKNAWKEGDNMLPNVNGSVRKRVALDLETSYTTTGALTEANKDNFSFAIHTWQAVGGNGDLNFTVAQVGNLLYFYRDTSVSLSATKYSFEVNMNSFLAEGYTGSAGDFPISLTSANGRCIVSSKCIDPILLTYNSTSESLSSSRITIRIRDFEGVSDGLGINTRPSVLTKPHKYNLLNQGWTDDLINTYYGSTGRYPSNAQSWVYGKNVNDDFTATVLDKQDFGTSPAPAGRYILDAFNEDRSTISGVPDIDTVMETTRPAAVAFYAGRAWYAGVGGSRLLSNVYFSQVAVATSNYGRCYQSADPTSEVISDLVDTDGGVIAIQDCGEILSLVATGGGVLVLASNGIWQIVGTAQAGFTATGYEVNKLSNFGCVSQGSVVLVNDTVVYWSHSAICQVSRDAVGGFTVSPITDTSIKTLYQNIPIVAKKYTSAAFNSSSKTIIWMYKEGMTDDTTYPYQKTSILALDTRLGAFFTLSFPVSTALPVFVTGMSTKESTDTAIEANVVTSSGDSVIADTDDVVADINVRFSSERQFKFLTVTPTGGVTFSDFLTLEDAPAKFRDWFSYNDVGEGYEAYVLTGLNFGGNGPTKQQQALYISTFMQKTETGFTEEYAPINASSCFVQGRWDFTDSTVANKWGPEQQIYRRRRMFAPPSLDEFDDGYAVVIAKSKIRGRGKSLQLMFTTEEDYDAVLLGWSVLGYGATNV